MTLAFHEYRKPVSLAAEILQDVAVWHKMPVRAITSRNQSRRYVLARWEASFLLKHCARKYSTTQIGRMLGRDHTTIVYALKRYRESNKP